MRRKNLSVQTGALVRRIRLEGERAVGVEYERKGKACLANAASEVIVSAGAYATPQLLMLSGVGPADHLRESGIECVVDSPNVGLHLQEHPLAFFNWHSNDPETLDDAADPRYLGKWLARGAGKLSSTVGEAVLHWRSQDDLDAPDFQFYFAPVYFWEHGFHATGSPSISIAFGLQAPKSRGTVRLRSADPVDQPRILNNMLTEDSDLEAMLRAADFVRELAAQPALSGLLGEQLNPGAAVSSRDDMVAWMRATCEHIYHPTSTCRIGPPDDGVVDPELRVYGIEALRVADASVMPRITSGNTNAPTYMIAERCADFIAGSGRTGSASVADAVAA
jgi:choline dehydrogenase